MKKVINIMAAFLMVCGFLMPSVVGAGVAGQYLDQTFENTGMSLGYMTIGTQETHGRVQTFKPTANKIVSVDVYLKDMVPDKKLSLMIKKESDGSVVAPSTESVPFFAPMPTGWITVAFTSPFVTVTPETEYGLYLSITGDNQTKWGYSDADPYARGQAKGFPGDDFLFRVYGVKDNSSTDAADSAKEAVVDESIKTPILTSIEKNDTKTIAPITKEITVGSKDKLILNGTSFKGAKVDIFINDKTLVATVDADGSWAALIEGAKYKEGDYTIYGLAKSSDTKVSEKAELLKIKVLGVKAVTEPAKKSIFASWNIFYALIPIGILLLALLLFALIARRHHQEKTTGNIEEKKEEKPTTEEPVEEDTKEETKKSKK